MSPTRPGVYVTEAPLARVVSPPVTTASVAAFLGTAMRGPTNPTLINSWSDFVANFGDFNTSVTLPYALFQYFRNTGGGPAYVSRVVGVTGAVAANKTFADGPTSPGADDRLKFTANEAGIWGNTFGFDIDLDPALPLAPATEDPTRATFTLTIYENYRNATVALERFTGLSMVPTHPRYIPNIINSTTIGSKYLTVAIVGANTGAKLKKGTEPPQYATSPVWMTGGVDGTGTLDYTAAFAEFDSIDSLMVVNLPGNTTDVSAIAAACQTRGDSFLVVDSAPDLAPAAVTSSLPETSYAGIYYPWIYIPDPSPAAPRGSVLKVPPGGSVVGMILRTEATRGVHKAPAGLGSALSGVVATERRLTNDDLDLLAGNKINALRPMASSGVTVMGARGRSNDIAQYISVRRTLNWVKKKAVDTSRFALFEPNDPTLWDQLIVANETYLTDLWQQGGLSGQSSWEAFYVKCDESNNTPVTIANGEVHVEIGVAPVFPAEFIIIRVGQFESDASVTVQEV